MAQPLVSVIITTYNHENYIRSAIEGCLMQQTSFPCEIIIHDDASTDNTANIIREYAEKHPNVIIPILQSENQKSKGVNKMQSFILPIVRGKYIARCEGDDYWIDPQKLEKQVPVMEGDPSISLCSTAVRQIFLNKQNKKETIIRHPGGDQHFRMEDAIKQGGSLIKIVSILFRKEIYSKIPPWYDISPVGDVVLALLAAKCGKIFYLDEVTAVYRRGVPGSWSQRTTFKGEGRKSYLMKLIRTYDVFNEDTHYEYCDLVDKKIRKNILKLLFSYSHEDKKLEDNYIDRLTFNEKLFYKVFNFTRLYHLYRFIVINVKG